jgi:hypothetical protein
MVVDVVGRCAVNCSVRSSVAQRSALHEWHTIQRQIAQPAEFFHAAFHSRTHRRLRASIESTCCLSACLNRA